MRKVTAIALSGVLVLMLAASLFQIPARATSPNLFEVWPSGDISGETDWSNIMNAFAQAVESGPGSTVQLAAGDFYVHRPIQVANFSGTVRGQGKELTRLNTAPGPDSVFGLLEYPLPPSASYMVLYLDGDWPADQTADVTVSDLSFYIDGPSELWGSNVPAVWNFMNVVDVRGIIRGYDDPDHDNFELTRLNVTFRHLKAVADWDPDEYALFGSSIYNSFRAWGEYVMLEYPSDSGLFWGRWVKPITGVYVFEDIEMYDSAFGLAVYDAWDSTIRIGGSRQNAIIARGTMDSVELQDISNSTVDVSYLNASGVNGGVFLIQGQYAAWGNSLGELVPQTLPEPSTFVFQHNSISSESGGWPFWYSAFELWNPGGEIGQSLGNVVITNNTINVVDHLPPFEGVLSYFVDNAQVTNNRVGGRGVAGIWVEPSGTPASGWLLQGNNVSTFADELAPVYLGPGTSNCTVVGGNTRTSVFDEGTDNILVGVNNQGGNPPGQALRDALAQKREAIKSLR